MTRFIRPTRWPSLSIAFLVLTVVLPAAEAIAQGAGGPIPATPPAPVPLSGRSAEGGAVIATQSVVAGAMPSVNTLAPSIQVQGPAAGSTTGGQPKPFSGALSLSEAVRRALDFNLSAVGFSNAVRQAQAEQTVARSALLPNVVGEVRDLVQRVNLDALGFRSVPGSAVPEVAGPFNLVDVRARLSQTILDVTALNNYRAARETVRASELDARDRRDLVVLAAGGAYLQALASRARMQSAQAQIDTATTLHRRTSDQRRAGLATPIDVNRAQIQLLSAQQRLLSLQADFSKQKMGLARMIGLPPTDHYDLSDDMAFSAAPVLGLEEALRQARERRSDLQAAQAHVRAAERALEAAQASRLPSVSVAADYGTSRVNTARATYSVVAAVRVPIWEGGRASGEIQRATAALAQRRAELEDAAAAIEADVRKAYLDIQVAASQVEVARMNVRVSAENLKLTRQRFDVGVGDNTAVVQSQEVLAAAELDEINSIFAHNLAKLNLARAMGRASTDLEMFLRLP